MKNNERHIIGNVIESEYNNKGFTDIKDVIIRVMYEDSLLVETLTEIFENKPKFGDLFRGTFVEKLKVMCKGFATFAVVFLDNYYDRYNVTEEELIDNLAKEMAYYIPALPIPVLGRMLINYIFRNVCHFLITYAMHYVKKTSQITIMYEDAFTKSIERGLI